MAEVHLDAAPGSIMPVAICARAVFDNSQLTQDVNHLTCADCIFRVLAMNHAVNATLLKTLAGLFVARERVNAHA